MAAEKHKFHFKRVPRNRVYKAEAEGRSEAVSVANSLVIEYPKLRPKKEAFVQSNGRTIPEKKKNICLEINKKGLCS